MSAVSAARVRVDDPEQGESEAGRISTITEVPQGACS